MSKNLRKCMKTMQHLDGLSKGPLRKIFLEEMAKKDCFFEAIYEIIDNIRHKNLNIPPSKRSELRKCIKTMEEIHKHPKRRHRREKLVKQIGSGFFLPIVLPILTTVISELIQNAVSKKSDSGSS